MQRKEGTAIEFKAGTPFPTQEQLTGAAIVKAFGPLSHEEVSKLKSNQSKYHYTIMHGDKDAQDAIDPPEE